jgi:hypothetical protein
MSTKYLLIHDNNPLEIAVGGGGEEKEEEERKCVKNV